MAAVSGDHVLREGFFASGGRKARRPFQGVDVITMGGRHKNYVVTAALGVEVCPFGTSDLAPRTRSPSPASGISSGGASPSAA